MKLTDHILGLQGQAVPAVIDGIAPMPEGATVLGTVPEEIRPIILSSISLIKEAEALKERFEATSTDDEAKAIAAEANPKYSLGKMLEQVFWYELQAVISPNDENDIQISNDWQAYVPKKEGCDCPRCAARRAGIDIPGIVVLDIFRMG